MTPPLPQAPRALGSLLVGESGYTLFGGLGSGKGQCLITVPTTREYDVPYIPAFTALLSVPCQIYRLVCITPRIPAGPRIPPFLAAELGMRPLRALHITSKAAALITDNAFRTSPHRHKHTLARCCWGHFVRARYM